METKFYQHKFAFYKRKISSLCKSLKYFGWHLEKITLKKGNLLRLFIFIMTNWDFKIIGLGFKKS